MSADNWAICPRCLAKAMSAKADLERRVHEEYGLIPVAEFDALRFESKRPLDERALSTFREDYEIYGAHTGTVRVDYSGTCTACGLKLVFEAEYPIPGVTVDAPLVADGSRLTEGVTDEAVDAFVESHGGR